MSPRTLAIIFTTLMLVSAMPPSAATHIDPLTPDAPALPRVQPTQDCAPTNVAPEILRRVNQASAGNPAFYQDDIGVASVCVNGAQVGELSALIRDFDKLLDDVRNISQEIQRNLDTRLEATFPESEYPNDLIGPRTVLLSDTFDGHRTGGFGDWNVVTDLGEPHEWNIGTVQDDNGTRNVYRFGSSDSYATGSHQWLVSPEIDLTALKGNKTAVQDLVALRTQARDELYFRCNRFTPQRVVEEGQGTLSNVCGRGATFSVRGGGIADAETPPLDLIVQAYEEAFDATIMELPVMRHGAQLDITFRMNLAEGLDGVRLWVYSGDRAPGRDLLFDPDLGRAATGTVCGHDPLYPLTPADPTHPLINGSAGAPAARELQCSPSLRGGEVITSLPHMRTATAFRGGPDRANDTAFSGDVEKFVTVRLNLTAFLDQRIWLLFEAHTTRDERGVDIFREPGFFARTGNYGFEISRIHVEGDAYHRNLRLKNVGADYPYVSIGNSFGDDPRTVRTTVPPGNDPVRVAIHNAGDYRENATLTVIAEKRANSPGASFSFAGRSDSFVRNITPDEVRNVLIPWSDLLGGGALAENVTYRINATIALTTSAPSLVVTDQTDSAGTRLPPALEANDTVVRPVNAASTIPGAGSLTASQLIRAAAIRNLTAIRADRADGNPVQVCSAVAGRACSEHFAAPKGELRYVLLGIRNDGNTAQDAHADIIVELDGVAKPDVVIDGARRELKGLEPGEVRPVSWTIVPTEPGTYRVAIAMVREGGVSEQLIERRVYSQRATGLVCLDTLETRECGAQLVGGLQSILLEENITASAVLPDGTFVVATTITEADADGRHTGILAARDPLSASWRILSNLSATRLNETFESGPNADHAYGSIRAIVAAPNGTLYLAGANSTLLARSVAGELTRIDAPIDHVNFTTAVWHKGGLLAAGSNGTLIASNATSTTRINVSHTIVDPANAAATKLDRYNGTFRSIIETPQGDLLLSGDSGILLRHAGSLALTSWTEPTMQGKIVAWAVGNRTLDALASHEGRIYVGGPNLLLINARGTTSAFQAHAAPPALESPTNWTAFATSHTGALIAIDSAGHVASCFDCASPLVSWQYATLPSPTVLGKGPAHPARVTQARASATETLLLGEAGAVLEFTQNGDYDNTLDWTTVPALAARDGGVLQTRRMPLQPNTSVEMAVLGVPTASGQDAADAATKFRVWLNHSVRAARPATTARAVEAVEVRLVYANVPALVISQAANTPVCPATDPQRGLGVQTVCQNERVRHRVARFSHVTSPDAWDLRLFDDVPAVPTTGDAGAARFSALELYAGINTRWAIDDAHLQGFVDGQWKTVVEWRGPTTSTGTWYALDVGNQTLASTGTEPANLGKTLLGSGGQGLDGTVNSQTRAANAWEVWPFAFDLETESPWHVTTQYAERPIFAANNEFYKAPDWANPAAPRLLDNWDSRLVSPVIDLKDAYDPAIEFRHLYSFRTQFTESTYRWGDGGVLEIQYQRTGKECGSTDPRVTCGWSQFYPVSPDRGYPTADAVGGNGLLPAGFNDAARPSIADELAYSNPLGRLATPHSFVGRAALPDAAGVITDPRATSNYITERVTLSNSTCTASQNAATSRCVPVNLTGRQVRFAFHLYTAGNYARNYADPAGHSMGLYNVSTDAKQPATFPGEGWFITDFKVLGAAKLGTDLAAKNLTFRVGYDVANIGVGPGTRVPVNVTVENRGAFDALGYTGTLEVIRVDDRALKLTTPVETITLTQQPVLSSGGSRNHTIYWTVPAAEKAEYTLRFTVAPVGIATDEDPVDNVVKLGTTSLPVIAKTVRQFKTEFIVSPANATIDITRYLPMYINNTGNVPLSDFTVERRIQVIGRPIDGEAATCAAWRGYVEQGRQTAIVDCREWTTSRAAPAGMRTPLTSISDDVSPTSDLFWKAPERASFLVSVAAKTQVGTDLLQSGQDRRVSALATYLYDDIEGGPRGESLSGTWAFGPGWNASQPGFRSADSYAFGDPALGRYPADANTTLASPLIDLGNARTASVAFYHKYAFEPSFDGGLLEASADGGQTWQTLTPTGSPATSAGYNGSHPIQPGSPIHPDGDPDRKAFAFTSDSSLLPPAVDGWVLSEFDLTNLRSITESRVPYEAYTSVELQRYGKAPVEATRANIRIDSSWCPGPADESRCWEIENTKQGTLTAPTAVPGAEGPKSFWWSGSASLADDGVAPLQNHLMMIDVDVSSVQSDQVVTADWWEYAARPAMVANYQRNGTTGLPQLSTGFFSDYMFTTSAAGAPTHRFNLGQPEILETRGNWYHMRSDLAPVLSGLGTSKITVGFAYTPLKAYSTNLTDGAITGQDIAFADNSTTTSQRSNYMDGAFRDDPGFAIDGFTIHATRMARGQPVGDPVVLMSEEAAWEFARTHTYECGIGTLSNTPATSGWTGGNPSKIACFHENNAWIKRAPLLTTPGRNWGLVTELPAPPASWGVVSVRDDEDRTATRPLPTGETPKAWWTGELPHNASDGRNVCTRNEAVKQVLCPRSGSESRLITPAFDLGGVAGTNAQLVFTHRYAFQTRNVSTAGGLPLASGGVVEMQEYDPQTRTWSAWNQIYSKPASLDVGPSVGTPYRADHRGGYTGVTANTTTSVSGIARHDAPFNNLVVPLNGRPTSVQYLYTGESTKQDTDGTPDGWMRESYDVSEFIGKRVRFAFHAWFSDQSLNSQGVIRLDAPDTGIPTPENVDDDLGGWWIADVGVVGNVIVGKPVQLRLRAGTDGNVQDGIWQVDDLGVFGSRYRTNVGLFVDQTPQLYGAYTNTTTTVPVTVRNLGDSVRRDLAVEIVNTNSSVALNLTSTPGRKVSYEGNVFRLEAITLGPGQSATIDVIVKTPTQAGTANKTQLLFQLKEFTPADPSSPFARITDNEVQGLLTRLVGFRVQDFPNITLARTSVPLAEPKLGEPVDLHVTFRNDGYGPTELNLTCDASTITQWAAVDHSVGNPVDTPTIAASYGCERISPDESIVAGRSSSTFVYRATPTAAGALTFRLNGHVVDGSVMEEIRTSVAVGTSAITWSNSFDQKRDAESKFRLRGAEWESVRGLTGPGALLIGKNETTTSGYVGTCPAGACRATSMAIDLHNYTTTSPPYLSFWHMDRFARHDGAQVQVSWLRNERLPNSDATPPWSQPCVLKPINGHEGRIRQTLAPPQGDGRSPTGGASAAGDGNAVFSTSAYNTSDTETRTEFFVSDGGVMEEKWSLAVFDLSQACHFVGRNELDRTFVPAGHTIRIEFVLYSGDTPNGQLRRGTGHGWLIDDISIGPLSLEVRPSAPQRAHLLDDTTKPFNLLVRNRGATTDVVTLEYDALNSSAPTGSVLVPTETYTLAPGESKLLTVQVKLPRDPSLLPTEFKARVLARSILDRNAVGSTTLDIGFGPRQWPELGITATLPRGIVQEGTDAFIPLVIENTGLVTSTATTIRVTDTWGDGQRIVRDLDLGPVSSYFESPEDSTRIVEFRWRPEKGSIGDHVLEFEVDPQVLSEEYTRDNNRIVLTVPVSELLIPDLHVANASALRLRDAIGGVVSPGVDADIARFEVTAGEVVTLELKVANRGRAGATNVDVRAFIGPLSLPPKTIPYIAPGSETLVTFNWLAQKGEYELEFLVRSEQVELSTANNRFPGRGLTLLTVKGYEVDITIPAIAGVLEPGSEIRVPFRIQNSGNAGEDLVLRATTPAGTRVQLPREGFFLRAGEAYEDTARLILEPEAVAGEQFITIEAIARENPMKVASGRASMRVNASFGGSVTAQIAIGAPPTLTVPIEIVNEGNSLDPWSVSVRLPAGWKSVETLPLKVAVPAHGRVTVPLQVSIPATTAPGERVLAIEAKMPNGEVRTGLARTSILPLRAAGVEIGEVTAQPARGSLTVPVVVENKGNIQQPFSLLLLDAPAGIALRVEPASFDLPPGGKAIAQLIVTPNATVEAGTYAVTGYTRFDGVTPASREGSLNVQSLAVPVTRQDVRLGVLEYAPRAGLNAGDRVSVKVTVTNHGLTPLTDMPVHLYVDDVFIQETRIPLLAAGGRADATFNWTALLGVHTLTAVLDPYSDTVDTDRADNAVSALATVGTEAARGGAIAAGRADTPAPGAFGILIAALAAALLVTQRNGSRRQRR